MIYVQDIFILINYFGQVGDTEGWSKVWTVQAHFPAAADMICCMISESGPVASIDCMLESRITPAIGLTGNKLFHPFRMGI